MSTIDHPFELADRAVQQDLRGTICPPQRSCDLPVVHPKRKAHDQCLAAVVRELLHALEDGLQLLAAFDQ